MADNEQIDPRNAGHIVSTYDAELGQLSSMILRMGGLAERQFARALDALISRDAELAEAVIADDAQIDEIDDEIDPFTTRMIALRQPVAVDLRIIMCALRMSREIERLGDNAKGMARRGLTIIATENFPAPQAVERIGRMVQSQLKAVLDAYAKQDPARAVAVWRKDADIDSLHDSLFQENLTRMVENPEWVGPCTQFAFILKNIERIGDHATNLAELVHFQVSGTRLADERPRPEPLRIEPTAGGAV